MDTCEEAVDKAMDVTRDWRRLLSANVVSHVSLCKRQGHL